MPMAHRNGFVWTADVAGRAVFAGRAVAGRAVAGRSLPPSLRCQAADHVPAAMNLSHD